MKRSTHLTRNIPLGFFDNNEIPTMTERDKESFQKLSNHEKLEFMNEWVERQRKLNLFWK